MKRLTLLTVFALGSLATPWDFNGGSVVGGCSDDACQLSLTGLFGSPVGDASSVRTSTTGTTTRSLGVEQSPLPVAHATSASGLPSVLYITITSTSNAYQTVVRSSKSERNSSHTPLSTGVAPAQGCVCPGGLNATTRLDTITTSSSLVSLSTSSSSYSKSTSHTSTTTAKSSRSTTTSRTSTKSASVLPFALQLARIYQEVKLDSSSSDDIIRDLASHVAHGESLRRRRSTQSQVVTNA